MKHSGMENEFTNSLSYDKWKKIGFNRRTGVVAPLFSIYSGESVGIGEFVDLKLLVDWCSFTGNSIIQLLPMNEVGPLFCPYDSISSFALEPAYISLRLIPEIDQKEFKSKIDKIKKTFPTGKTYVNYAIKEAKIHLLWEVFKKNNYFHSGLCQEYVKKNTYWIYDFALFKILKYYQQGKAWEEWEDGYRDREDKKILDFSKAHEQEIEFQIWLQWQLYQQFVDVKKYAQDKNVLIKGDLPVLVSRDSADVWACQDFFKLEFAAGAPPDMYCACGQRWGMPTYNWNNIIEDDFKYIKEKLKYSENFYDLLRIDHVVGLFRIWSIPYNLPSQNQGMGGIFDPQNESEWYSHGERIISVLNKSTKMLLCAEDLGVIPKACPEVLNKYGIPGNDVQRWVKDWKVKHDFLMSEGYRLLSVAVLSTHDTTNWPAWWEFEAGTVDEEFFKGKCSNHGIDYETVKNKLFNFKLSHYGRLRWLNNVTSADVLAHILQRDKKHIMDIIETYENTYQEKEKLWHLLKLNGPVSETANKSLIEAIFKFILKSNAVFSIQLIFDWLFFAGILKDETYKYRINRPGTISGENWSLTLPISLEKLIKHKSTEDIACIISSSGRK